jgi:translation initiation factor 1 (eIF-1/SUI1)
LRIFHDSKRISETLESQFIIVISDKRAMGKIRGQRVVDTFETILVDIRYDGIRTTVVGLDYYNVDWGDPNGLGLQGVVAELVAKVHCEVGVIDSWEPFVRGIWMQGDHRDVLHAYVTSVLRYKPERVKVH